METVSDRAKAIKKELGELGDFGMDDEDMQFLRDEKYDFDQDYYSKGLVVAAGKRKAAVLGEDDYEDDFDV